MLFESKYTLYYIHVIVNSCLTVCAKNKNVVPTPWIFKLTITKIHIKTGTARFGFKITIISHPNIG